MLSNWTEWSYCVITCIGENLLRYMETLLFGMNTLRTQKLRLHVIIDGKQASVWSSSKQCLYLASTKDLSELEQQCGGDYGLTSYHGITQRALKILGLP